MPDGAPATVTIPDLTILRPGTFAASTGKVTITDDDIADALAAFADPQIDAAPVKLGHVGNLSRLGDSAPGLGWLSNMRLGDDGAVIVDLADVPAGLEPAIRAGFKRRSAELSWGVKTTDGKKYRMVIDGLALLGVQEPAIKDLGDLQSLYTPAKLASEGLDVDGHSLLALFDATAPVVPDRAEQIAERLRWARESAAQLAAAVGQIAGLQAVWDALNAMVPADSRGLLSGAPHHDPDAPPTAPHGGKPMSKFKPETIKLGRTLLSDVPDDASDEDVAQALTDAGVEPDGEEPNDGGNGNGDNDGGEGTPPPSDLAAAAQAAGLVLVPQAALEQIQQGAAAGAEARALLAAQQRDAVLDAAYQAGKLGAGEAATKVRSQLAAQLERDFDGTKALIDLMPAVVPVTEIGNDHVGHADLSAAAEAAIDQGIADLFAGELPTPAKEA